MIPADDRSASERRQMPDHSGDTLECTLAVDVPWPTAHCHYAT